MPAQIVAWTFAFCLTLVGLAGSASAAETKPGDTGGWHFTVEVPSPPRRGQPPPPAVGHLWLPKEIRTVRGLVFAGHTSLEATVCRDAQVRKAAAEKGMGVLYFRPALDAIFDFVHRDSPARLERALAELARKTGRPELAFAPLLTVGHSTGGIFCRNVAFWKPHRVIGIIHIKSGNFQDGLWDLSRSIAGVPFLAINGEFESVGPKGGDLGRGLRSAYSLHPTDKKKQNQTQWVMIRMQMIERRRKNPDNLMSLVIHRGHGHGGWDERMSAICAQFIRSAADARIPQDPPDAKSVVRCRALKAEDGWLSDADIKAPTFKPAPYAQYKGDGTPAFWHLDRATAEIIHEYHAGPWEVGDPTAGLAPAERYTPPPILRDLIDAPSPKTLAWQGGDGTWDDRAANWTDGKTKVKWDGSRKAVFGGRGRTVSLAANLECAGLALGKGYTLVLGAHELQVRWHAALDRGATLRVTLTPDDRRRRRGRLHVAGNAGIGCALVLAADGDIEDGTYPIVTTGGNSTGTFSEVIPPKGYTAEADRGSVALKRTTGK